MTYTISQTPSAKNEYLYPDGDSVVNLSRSTGATNYVLIDETWNDPNDIDYVYTLSITELSDVYTVANSAVGAGTINFVRVFGRAKSLTYDQHSSGVYKLLCDDGTESTIDKGSIINSWTRYYATWATKPSGGAWGWANINAMKIGVKCNSPNKDECPIDEPEFYPNADGDVNEHTVQPAGTAWQVVDEDPANTTDYIRSTSGTKDDLFNIPNHTTETGTITKIKVYAYLKKTGGSPTFKISCRPVVSGTTYYDDPTACTTSWAYYSKEWALNPEDSQAWEWADIDALQIGVQTTIPSYQILVSQIYVVVTQKTSPEIQTSQCHAVVNYTPSASVVTLNDPKNVDGSHSRNLVRKNLPSGNYIVYDGGRGSKTLTIIGTETSGAYSDMNDMKTICHYGAKVTIAGLDDTNLNTDYWVSDIQFSAGPGYPANMYDYKLTLEEL